VLSYSLESYCRSPEQPVTIQLQCSYTPESMPSVTVNQQFNHIATSTDRAEGIRQHNDGANASL